MGPGFVTLERLRGSRVTQSGSCPGFVTPRLPWVAVRHLIGLVPRFRDAASVTTVECHVMGAVRVVDAGRIPSGRGPPTGAGPRIRRWIRITLSPRIFSTLLLGVALALVPAAGAMAKTDGDGMPSKWEKRHHLSVRINDAAKDPDKDGLSNFGEYRSHTDPRRRDSDRDHRSDGREDFDRDKLRNTQEIKTGNDPGDSDSDDDGIKDGRENAGRITAAGAGSVTIALAVGGTLSARLGPDLFCAAASATPWSDAPAPAAGGDEAGDVPDPGEDDESDDLPGDNWAGDDAAPAEAAQADEDADPSDDAPDDGVLDPDAMACASALKVGAGVHEAEVMSTSDGLVLVTIDLLQQHH
jgi:hypothetical protein